MDPVMSGLMLFAADYVPVRDFGRYGVLIFFIYIIGTVVMIPIAAHWCEDADDKSSNLSQFLSKFVSLVRNNYGAIFFICILWPLTPVYFWLFSKFSFIEVFYFVGALALGIVAVEVTTKASSSTLVSVLEEGSPKRARVARQLLAERADRQTIEPLMTLARQDPSDRVRSRAVHALGPFADEQVLDLVVLEFTKPKGEATGAAAYVLRHHDTPLLVGKLLPILGHSDARISRSSREVLEPLIKRLVLAGNFDPETVDGLIDQNIQEYAALWAQVDKEIIAPQSVRDERKYIIKSLENYVAVMGLVDTPRSTKTLVSLLGKPDISHIVRWIAAKSLGRKSASVDAVQALTLALEKTKEGSVRHHIVVSLGDIGNQRAVPQLVKSLTDWHEGEFRVGEIQREAANALSKLGWEPSNVSETIHLAAARKDKELLLEKWTDTRQVLLEDVVSQQQNPLNNALLTFIRLGKDSVLPDLVSILEEQGSLSMANAYLRSGNEILNSAAKKWAAANGYFVEQVERTTSYPKWGK